MKRYLGLPKGKVRIVPYHSAWRQLFEKEKKKIDKTFGQRVEGIEHIGSTAIPGMPAKPVIHILVAIKKLSDAPQFTLLLKKIGYVHRELPFKSGRVFFAKGPENRRTFHLSLVAANSAEWRDSLLFCEYLLTHKDAALEYANLKISLAKKFANDRNAYTAAKQTFIRNIIREAKRKSPRHRSAW